MGRSAFGAGNVMKALIELAGEKVWVEGPLDQLGSKTGLGCATIRRYLDDLEKRGFIKFIYGDYRRIKRLSIEKKDLASLEVAKKIEPVKTPKVEIQREPPKPWIVILVDYDNVFIGARDAGFNASFSKLKDYLRGFGNILFADVFLSPTALRRQETIALLDKSGFQIIACPMASKDTDRVDAKINWRARQYLSTEGVEEIAIVSNDRDFQDLSDFAADRHKKVRFIDVVKERGRIEGYDEQARLVEGTQVGNFSKAINYLVTNQAKLTGEEEQRVQYLKEIIRELSKRKIEREQDAKPGFRYLHRYLSTIFYNTWGKIFPDSQLQFALSALVNQKVLITHMELRITYYTLNTDHPAVKKLAFRA